MRNLIGVPCLEYFARHGLDIRILSEYKSFGMLYYSIINHNTETASIDRFVDFAGIDYKWIKQVDKLENELNITPYHILIDFDTDDGIEITIMYINNKISLDYQYNQVKKGIASTIKLYPDKNNLQLFKDINYRVKLGAVIEEHEK